MSRNSLLFYYALLVLFAAMSSSISYACASCGCTLSSDWQEPAPQTNFKFDLRYDYIDQNQLRAGLSTISPTAASQITNNGNRQEVEKYTINNYVTASLNYIQNENWSFSFLAPYIMRRHSTLGTASDGVNAGDGGGQYTSSTANVGDVKVLGRFQGFSEQHNWGLLFGMKLPTGSHTLMGNSTDPTSPGTIFIDRGLQPGTGTTDALLGLFYSQEIFQNFSFFGDAFYQAALNSVDEYRPGDGINLNLGLRYIGLKSVTPQLQINTRFVQRDSGASADTISTGGTLVYLSPGVTVPIKSDIEIYVFAQIPIYQYVYGVQLVPSLTGSFGTSYNF